MELTNSRFGFSEFFSLGHSLLDNILKIIEQKNCERLKKEDNPHNRILYFDLSLPPPFGIVFFLSLDIYCWPLVCKLSQSQNKEKSGRTIQKKKFILSFTDKKGARGGDGEKGKEDTLEVLCKS